MNNPHSQTKHLEVLTRLQASATPTNDHAQNAIIPAAMWREFVDTHAAMLYESAHPAGPDRSSVLEEAALVAIRYGQRCISTNNYEAGADCADDIAAYIRALKNTAPQVARVGEGSLTNRDADVGEQLPAAAVPEAGEGTGK